MRYSLMIRPASSSATARRPQHCTNTISAVRTLMDQGVPMLGICLGAQIIGLAGKAQTYKLKYGHRGPKQVVP